MKPPAVPVPDMSNLTKEQLKAVTVASGNSRLESVTIHCSDGPVSAFRWTLDGGVLTVKIEKASWNVFRFAPKQD